MSEQPMTTADINKVLTAQIRTLTERLAQLEAERDRGQELTLQGRLACLGELEAALAADPHRKGRWPDMDNPEALASWPAANADPEE